MERPIDAALAAGERAALLDEMQAELPLWLERGASIGDAATEITDLLRFSDDDLRRCHAVHQCVNEAVQRLVADLPRALRAPTPSSQRPVEIAPAIRGPIDWPATVRIHAAGDPASYVTRPRRRTFDTPEHRALQWTLQRLAALASVSRLAVEQDDEGEGLGDTVGSRIDAIQSAVRRAARSEWLRDVPAQRPSSSVRRRLASSRSRFIRHALAPVVELLLADLPDGQALAELLRQRYFVPARDWRLYEVVVLIRIDRALCSVAPDNQRHRLLADSGIAAQYRLAGASTIVLRQQGWPPRSGVPSRRQQTAARHGLVVAPTIPDVIIERTGVQPDRLILELKASRNSSTIGGGLSQLLGYLNERPGLFSRRPAGWLVPLPQHQLRTAPPDPAEPLWIVSSDHVAGAVVHRLVQAP